MIQSVALLANSDWSFLAGPDTLPFAIPITAILVWGIIAITKILIRHRERMAMIERGMHPDHPPEESGPQNQS